jgi:hypothetical protein
MHKLLKAFPTNISKKEASDTGMAMVLILLLVGYFTGNTLLYKLAIPVLVLNMIWPMLFYPVAVVWLGFSHLLGGVMSKILLTVVFSLVVVPIGLLRQMMGKDSMRLKSWKSGTGSVMQVRNKIFQPKDLSDPF